MQANFALFFRQVLEDEGTTYEDVAGDNGGPTKCGITIADAARWNGVPLPHRGAPGWNALVAKVRELDPAKAGMIYKRFYWDEINADALPTGIDYLEVDYAVNSGTGRAIPKLRQVLGISGSGFAADAPLVEALAKSDLPDVVNRAMDERKAFLTHLCDVNEHDEKFRHGWMNRVASVRHIALGLVARAAEPKPAAAAALPKAYGEHPDDAATGAIVGNWAATITAEPPSVKASVVATASTLASFGKVANGSRTVKALAAVFAIIWGLIEKAWDGIQWVLEQAPDIAGIVRQHLSVGEEFSEWFGFNWPAIKTVMVVVSLAVAICLLLNDKHVIAQRKEAPNEDDPAVPAVPAQ